MLVTMEKGNKTDVEYTIRINCNTIEHYINIKRGLEGWYVMLLCGDIMSAKSLKTLYKIRRYIANKEIASIQDIIHKAYEFEIEAIKRNDSFSNPYYYRIMKMINGQDVWEIVNIMVERYFQ